MKTLNDFLDLIYYLIIFVVIALTVAAVVMLLNYFDDRKKYARSKDFKDEVEKEVARAKQSDIEWTTAIKERQEIWDKDTQREIAEEKAAKEAEAEKVVFNQIQRMDNQPVFQEALMAIKAADTHLHSMMMVDPKLTQNIQTTINYYNPSRGRFTSWWQRGKAEARVALQRVLNDEQILIIQQAATLEREVMDGKRRQVDFSLYVAQNATVLIELKAKAELINQAVGTGMTAQAYSDVNQAGAMSGIKKDEAEHTLSIDQRRAAIGITEKKELLELEHKQSLEAHQVKSKIDLDNEAALAMKEIELAIMADNLQGEQEILLLQDLIDKQIKEIEKIRFSENHTEETKIDLIAGRNRIIEIFKKKQESKAG